MVAMINEQYIGRNKQFSVVGKCRDGKSAMEFLEENKVDLVILDVFMPYADGFETLRHIRKKQIPTQAIMVTAANDREALEEALRLGIVDYLVKPFNFERFQVALNKFVSQQSALDSVGTLNQSSIDYIIDGAREKSEAMYPKGIQDKTLKLIMRYLDTQNGWLTGEDIAASTGLTAVTVRRYMNYLSQSGKAIAKMNYDTGGRPCMMYKKG